MEPIIGIDLGTTNSEVAFIYDGNVEIIADGDHGILPSCVGLNADGKIIVGAEARNQMVIAPERTAMSVKRLMGSDETIKLADQVFTPQEISAFILKTLKERAEKALDKPIRKAVITVPAYFTDTQRQATREAGEIAGLEVVRIINEPTAAALAYEMNNAETRQILIYDLGGGTFDVSIVKIEEGVIEVLASTGDNHLGGDDFDQKITNHLAEHIESELKLQVKDDPLVMARLRRAAESAKMNLSTVTYTTIEEDHLGKKDGRDIHLSLEFSRVMFEDMIDAELSRTMESVSKALEDAGLPPTAISKTILVGGSTRIPRITEMLEEKIGHAPHGEIDPDLCVALGAAMQAGREMGVEHSGVLVDITPYTFGTSALGMLNNEPNPDTFVPLIRRNTKLPARKSKSFYTVYDHQDAVDVKVYQGEAKNALDNVKLGNYTFYITKSPRNSEIILDFDLDLNGILKIKAIEKKTGKHIDAVIENAISRFDEGELSQTRERVENMWSSSGHAQMSEADVDQNKDSGDDLPAQFGEIVKRADELLDLASDEDKQEIINLKEDIQDAVKDNRMDDAEKLKDQLDDILFYIG